MASSVIKFANFVASLIAAAAVIVASQGCSMTGAATVGREALVADLKPITEIERQSQMITQIVGAMSHHGILDDKSAMGLKERYDLYYIYHMAAAVHLAHGERAQYLRYVELARHELDAMESIIKSVGREYFQSPGL